MSSRRRTRTGDTTGPPTGTGPGSGTDDAVTGTEAMTAGSDATGTDTRTEEALDTRPAADAAVPAAEVSADDTDDDDAADDAGDTDDDAAADDAGDTDDDDGVDTDDDGVDDDAAADDEGHDEALGDLEVVPGGSHAAGGPRTDAVAPVDSVDTVAAQELATLHLRMGLLTLARAELEALAMLGALDDDGRVALAVARWRTDDLAGAGVLALPLAEAGSVRLEVLTIAAESIAAQGRPGEARRLVERAMAVGDVPLAVLFAGLPRHAAWPDEPAEVPGQGTVRAPIRTGADASATSSAAAEAYVGGRAALAAGDPGRAALRMGVALRLDPEFARQVLDVLGTRVAEPELALVAGDALRILGREQEALAAFDVARGASGTSRNAGGIAGRASGGTGGTTHGPVDDSDAGIGAVAADRPAARTDESHPDEPDLWSTADVDPAEGADRDPT